MTCGSDPCMVPGRRVQSAGVLLAEPLGQSPQTSSEFARDMAYDVLVDIHNHQCLLTVRVSTGGQVKEEFTRCFEVTDFSKTYELVA